MTLLIKVNGEEMTVKEALAGTDISVNMFHNRIRRGWSVEQAVTVPLKEKCLESTDIHGMTAWEAKRPPKGREIKLIARCTRRCNSK